MPERSEGPPPRFGYTRRGIFERLGAGARLAVWLGALGGGIGTAAGADCMSSPPPLRVRRLVPRLPPFVTGDALTSVHLKETLLDIAKPGGLLDAHDDLAAGPIQLIIDPGLSANNPNNP